MGHKNRENFSSMLHAISLMGNRTYCSLAQLTSRKMLRARYGPVLISLCVIVLYTVLLRSKAANLTEVSSHNDPIPYFPPTNYIKEDNSQKSAEHIYQQALLKLSPTQQTVLKPNTVVHILLGLLYVGQQPLAAAGAKDTIAWILLHSSVTVHFHVLADSESQDAIADIFRKAGEQASCRYTYQVELLGQTYHDLLSQVDKHFPTITLPMIQETLITQMLPLILPWHYPELDRVIFLNPKLKFRADIAQLYAQFDKFEKEQVMGVTLTQNAKFMDQFGMYRLMNSLKPRLGQLEPEGWPGFDVDLILLDLQKMRESKKCHELTNLERQFHIMKKYEFPTKETMPNLEEWLTLMGVESPSIFYTLPCEWNVQQKVTHSDDNYKSCSALPKAMQF